MQHYTIVSHTKVTQLWEFIVILNLAFYNLKGIVTSLKVTNKIWY